jgi:hypothetical protein
MASPINKLAFIIITQAPHIPTTDALQVLTSHWELDKQQDRTYRHKPLTGSESDTETQRLKIANSDTDMKEVVANGTEHVSKTKSTSTIVTNSP